MSLSWGGILVGPRCAAWNRAHKDSIRAALVKGRGANTIRGKRSGTASSPSFKSQVGRCSQGLLYPDPELLERLRESLILAGIHTNKGRAISAYAEAFTQQLKPTWCLLVCISFIVG
eukprot:1160722-Pelagomonas_calceolata.AAC.18